MPLKNRRAGLLVALLSVLGLALCIGVTYAQYDSSGALSIGAGTATSLTLGKSSYTTVVSGPLQAVHYMGSGSAPGGAVQTGAGTGGSPSCTVAGNDAGGTITLVTGSASTTASSAQCIVTFATAYASAPRVQISPSNAAAAALSGTSNPFVAQTNTTTTTFTITSNTAALALGATYIWNYDVVQ